ncbi:hypothetical protein CUC08_Gglean013036 [Alternaria sp. MG1]|nr:hypothetical protein CUC08_Gglean013036 [Alternaria sp. MG1]
MSDFWSKKFKPAIQHVLNAQTDEAGKATLEKTFRRQSNNAATAARWNAKKHYAQLGRTRYGNTTEWGELPQYLMSQETVYELDEKLMPPQSVQNAAKYRMQIHADGTMTALAQENDADGDVDEEQFMTEEEAQKWTAYVGSEERQQSVIDGFWAVLQPHWQQSYNNAAAKIRLLCDHPFDVYVEQMTGAKYKAYLDFIFKDYTRTLPPRSGRLALMREAWEKTTIKYKRDIVFDASSELPVPPFSLLFRRNERVIMAIVLSAQLGGYYEVGGLLQLASKGQLHLLPPPFGEQTFSNRKFPYLAIDAKEAAGLLSEIGNPDDRPDDVDPYINLPQLGIELEDNDISKDLVDGEEDEDESGHELDVWFDGTLSDFDQSYNSDGDDEEVIDTTKTTEFEKKYTKEDKHNDGDDDEEESAEESLQEVVPQEVVSQEVVSQEVIPEEVVPQEVVPEEEMLQEEMLQEEMLQEEMLQEELLRENNAIEEIKGPTDNGDPMDSVEMSGTAQGGDASGK